MKKFLVNALFFLISLGLSILIFYYYLDEQQWQLVMQQKGFWVVIKPVAKWVLVVSLLIWMVLTWVLAGMRAIRKRKQY